MHQFSVWGSRSPGANLSVAEPSGRGSVASFLGSQRAVGRGSVASFLEGKQAAGQKIDLIAQAGGLCGTFGYGARLAVGVSTEAVRPEVVTRPVPVPDWELITQSTPFPSLQGLSLPLIAVFDLDETCWKHYGLDHKTAAFKPPFSWCTSSGKVVDSQGKAVQIFPELRQVLLALHQAEVLIAVASHDGKPTWCSEVLDSCVLDEDSGLTWGDLVPHERRIINSSGAYWPGKGAHLRDIASSLQEEPCQLKDMLVFDDSKSVCNALWKLGAITVRCVGGVSVARLMEGLQSLATQKGQKRKLGG